MAAKLMVAYLLVLFGLTLGGFYQTHAPRNFVPFRSMEHDIHKGGVDFVVNLVGNLVAFLPMGWLLPALLGRRCSGFHVGGMSLAISLLIEVLQGISGRRVADVDDLILNTLGGLIGFGLWLALGRLRRWGNRADQEA
jgi:glycopeptide antibiotics resistance protein